jgi:sodium-dependent dicarboxylate transporter 2/3/5
VRIAIGVATALLSMWISNTAAAAMMLPIALGLVLALHEGGVRESPRAILLSLAFAASIGGVATPIGTPPNLIALGFLSRIGGIRLDFLRFMAVGLPLSLLLLGGKFALLRWLHPPAVGSGGLAERICEERGQLAPWGPGQRACAIGFALAVALWLLPGVVTVLGVPETSLLGRVASAFPEAVVAVLVAGLLFAWPVDKRRVISWEEGRQVDFGTLFLFGGGLSLGKMMFDTGLAEAWGRALVDATGVSSLWGLTALATLVAILLTETTSNTAAVSMLAPLVLALCAELHVPIVPPVLGVAFGASMAFMLPISTPPNAIVYGTGRVPLMTMLRAGVLLDVVSFFVIQGVLRLMCPLLGLV